MARERGVQFGLKGALPGAHPADLGSLLGARHEPKWFTTRCAMGAR